MGEGAEAARVGERAEAARAGERAEAARVGERAARWVAVAAAAATCAMAATLPVLAGGLEGAPGVPYAVSSPQDMVIAPVYALIGVALVWLRTRNAVGWILLAMGAGGMASEFLAVYGIRAYVHPEAGLPGREIALSTASWLWLPGLVMLPTLLPLLYPSGHVPSPRWRLALLSTGVGLVAVALAAGFSVEAVDDWYVDARPPFVLPTAAQAVLGAVGVSLLAGTAVACVGNAAWRLWRADATERAQLAWLLSAAVLAVALAFAAPVEWVFDLAIVMVPLAVALGVLRYRLLGIELVLRPTLLYTLLTLMVALVFAGVTTTASLVLPSGPLPTFLAAAVVAVGLVPAHARVRRFVARLVDGPVADPLAAVGGVGRAVAGAGDADLVMRMLTAVAETIGTQYVALLDVRGRPVAATCLPTEATLDLALTYAGEPLGTLSVAAPARGLTPTQRAMLDTLLPQVAVVTRAATLVGELEDARSQLVEAAAAERGRLRRDLHDGLGPSLSGAALGLEAAQEALRRDPDTTDRILTRLRLEVRGAVDEVRRILDGLRPTGLDALGLVGALRHTLDHRDGLAVEVDSDGDVSPIDPEVETAAYRIALEAVTNARRHALAEHCTVRVSGDGDLLRIEVRDDGQGLPSVPHQGVGMVSMRHRAEALGGTFRVHSGPAGTAVVACLPRQRS